AKDRSRWTRMAFRASVRHYSGVLRAEANRLTFEIGLLLVIVVAAVLLFWWEWVSADVVALGLLLTLVFTGLLPTRQAFAGFSNDAVIMILGLLIMTAALQRTGVMDLA